MLAATTPPLINGEPRREVEGGNFGAAEPQRETSEPPRDQTCHSLGAFASLGVVELQQVDHSLTQELVEPHLSPVHDDDEEGAAVGVARVEERQVERSLFFPHRSDASLRHGRGELVFGHLDDGVRVVGAILALDAEPPSLVHGHLDAGGVPPLALVGQRHGGNKNKNNNNKKEKVRQAVPTRCFWREIKLVRLF